MASSGRDARRAGSAGERRSVVQAMRAAGRGRGGRQRSPAFEVRTSAPESSAASLKKLLRQARASGSLNLTSRGLEEVPEQVFNLIGMGVPSCVVPLLLLCLQCIDVYLFLEVDDRGACLSLG